MKILYCLNMPKLFYLLLLLVFSQTAIAEPASGSVYTARSKICKKFIPLSMMLVANRDKGMNQSASIEKTVQSILKSENQRVASILRSFTEVFAHFVYKYTTLERSDVGVVGYGFCILVSIKNASESDMDDYMVHALKCGAKNINAKELMICNDKKLVDQLKYLPNLPVKYKN